MGAAVSVVQEELKLPLDGSDLSGRLPVDQLSSVRRVRELIHSTFSPDGRMQEGMLTPEFYREVIDHLPRCVPDPLLHGLSRQRFFMNLLQSSLEELPERTTAASPPSAVLQARRAQKLERQQQQEQERRRRQRLEEPAPRREQKPRPRVGHQEDEEEPGAPETEACVPPGLPRRTLKARRVADSEGATGADSVGWVPPRTPVATDLRGSFDRADGEVEDQANQTSIESLARFHHFAVMSGMNKRCRSEAMALSQSSGHHKMARMGSSSSLLLLSQSLESSDFGRSARLPVHEPSPRARLDRSMSVDVSLGLDLRGHGDLASGDGEEKMFAGRAGQRHFQDPRLEDPGNGAAGSAEPLKDPSPSTRQPVLEEGASRAPKKEKRRKKPALRIDVSETGSNARAAAGRGRLAAESAGVSPSAREAELRCGQLSLSRRLHHLAIDNRSPQGSGAGDGGPGPASSTGYQLAALDASYQLSQSGAFEVSDFRITTAGIELAPNHVQAGGAEASDTPPSPSPLSNGHAGQPEGWNGYTQRNPGGPAVPSPSSAAPFVEILALGAGASGTVVKALHVPTMMLVALKSLPLFDQHKRHQMIQELRLLYQNMASLHSTPVAGPPTSPAAAAAQDQPEPHAADIRQRMRQGRRRRQQQEEEEEERRRHRQQQGADQAGHTPLEQRQGDTAFVADTLEESLSMSASLNFGPAEGRPARSAPAASRGATSLCPSIVTFYDAYIRSDTGQIALVVEYMNGGSLQDVVDRGGCRNEEFLASVASGALRGLAFLHGQRKIHRDIKPANILINTSGDCKVADFGIYRDLEGESVVKTFIGSLLYMSPERITGGQYGCPGDIWAIGLTIMTVALGGCPIAGKGGGYWDVLHQLTEKPPPKLPNHMRFSPEFQDFLACMLVCDPQGRWTAEELLRHPFVQRHDGKPPSPHRAAEERTLRAAELEQILTVLEAHSTTIREQLQRAPESANPRAVPSFDSTKIGCLAAQLGLPFLLVQEAVQQHFPDLLQP
uniref:mitogen-activated protein kinase kinase n=1 Tax=Rhizochromulina marina TaxID=1034831 RepID=A0A7S2S527_9STRA